MGRRGADRRSKERRATGVGSRGAWQGGLRGGPRGARCLGKARGLGQHAARKLRAAGGRGAARLAESFPVPLFEHV
jgi:hypothetical protein